MREEGGKIKFEGGVEGWWAMFRSGSGSGSMENIIDPEPAKLCRSADLDPDP